MGTSAWSALRHRSFALLWGAALVSNIGSWMHDLAAGWLMTTLNPDPLIVSMVQAATILPIFMLALPAGAIASRLGEFDDVRKLEKESANDQALIESLIGVKSEQHNNCLIHVDLLHGLYVSTLKP